MESQVNTPFEADPTRYATDNGNRESPPKTRASFGGIIREGIIAGLGKEVERFEAELAAAAFAATAPKKPRKPKKTSPTQRSLKHMRELGYLCAIVEHWNQFAHIRQDLYGFIDVLCVKGEDIVGVQATSGANVAARVTKITEHENWPLICKAIRIIVHGWRKNAAGKWVLREVEL